jgi:hypothetical protein
MDAIGLLFFIIPGLIAFAIDISTGTIYMGGSSLSLNNNLENIKLGDLKKIKIDPNNITNETVAAAIKESTGLTVDLNDPNLKIFHNKKLEAKLVSL